MEVSAASVLLVDNFDSFTYNLVDAFRVCGAHVEVWRNTCSADFLWERVVNLPKPRLIVFSPGPSTPEDAPNMLQLIKKALGVVPIFGVCLGHQALVHVLGGTIGRAEAIVHGKVSWVEHSGSGLFAGVDNPCMVARYHSLVAHSVPDCLRVIARTVCAQPASSSCVQAITQNQGLVMAVEHTVYPALGVQFHPESLLTPQGVRMIENVLSWACEWETLHC